MRALPQPHAEPGEDYPPAMQVTGADTQLVSQAAGGLDSAAVSTHCSLDHSVRLARFTSDAGLLSKTISLAADGTLAKRSAAELSSGKVENLVLPFDGLPEVLTGLSCNQALAYGVSLGGDGAILSEREWVARGSPAAVLLRNRKHMGWPVGPAVMMVDHDPADGVPALVRDRLLEAFYEAMPELRDAPHFWRPSASSCVYDSSTGEEIRGVTGQRLYFLVDDGREIERVGKLLVNRLWLIGHGYIKLSQDGRCLERTLADALVWQPERLDFAAGAQCTPPLEQRRPPPMRFGGFAPLATRDLCALTEAELQKIAQLKKIAKDSREPEARKIREKRIKEKTQKLQTRGLDEKTAVAVAQYAYEQDRLLSPFVLTSKDDVEVTVDEILNNPEQWHDARFHDPIDPECVDPRIAMVNLFSGGRPYLWSHAHGGRRFELCRAVAEVQVGSGNTAAATAQILDFMRNSMSYYERGHDVVVVTMDGEVYSLGQFGLKQRLEHGISFIKWDGRQDKFKRVDCPDEIAKRILDMRFERGLPRLSGIGTFPTMTADGRVLERPGYDEETGILLLNPSGDQWPRVPAHPTEEQVLAALQRLWAPVARFPYIDDVSRGITLAAMLTAVARRGLRTAPAFMFGAPVAGSGKTLLATCVVALAGRSVLMTLPTREEEVEKTLISSLRQAPAALFFDNVVGEVNSIAVNAMLTSDTYQGRILGISKMSGPLPTNALVIMTGNNARPVGDTCRRMLVGTIDPAMEDPYKREFDFDPFDRIRADQMTIVIDALTILSAWTASGLDRVARGNLASFEAWDRLVRQAVVWVGQLERSACGARATGFGDPVANINAQFAADDETECLGQLLETWNRAQPGGLRASQLLRAVNELGNGHSPHDELGQVAAALLEAVPKVSSAKIISRWLRSVKGRIVRGLRVEGERGSDNTTIWHVRRAVA
jgi:hypothetical protein